ncbi:MAG: sodium-independent anion transporter [Acidobacteria bacterium]|nr:MAG: sodium-independent anion transporter [Acidobacteriota bacterium]
MIGRAEQLHRVTDHIDALPPIVMFRLRNMTAIDATGLKALEDAAARLRASGRATIFCGAPSQPAQVMQRSGFFQHVGAENICANVDAALVRAAELRAQRLTKTG